MPTLYNCHHSGDQYRITKFDDDMNPQSSYLCTTEECECPAGVRPTCRHRQMLPKFIARGHVGDEWFLDFDRGGWVQMGKEWLEESAPVSMDNWRELARAATVETTEMPPLPEGISVIVLDSPDKIVDVHNAIADAVGEPQAKLTPRHIPRRF